MEGLERSPQPVSLFEGKAEAKAEVKLSKRKYTHINMAPPKKGGIHGAEQAKERLTAVVMADSFTQRFQPVTVERPKVLLPLVNVPLLDYTLEWLSMNRIEECYVFCCAHADQIEAYLEANRRAGRHRKMRVMPIISTNCMSMGDALRFLDHKDILKTDFVLVSGDVITNVRLLHVLEAHRRRRAADKSAIMTLLMRGGVLAPQRARFGDIGTRIAMDPETGRLLKYEEDQYPWLPAAPVKPQRFRVDASLFSERDDIVVRTDLMISGIYICSPEVLMLFSDNFDYQNIRRDFVIGVLSEEELGNKLYVHEITKEYAARVHTLRSYDAISRDVLQRWTYPLVPDTNIFKAVTKLEGFRWQEQGSGNLDTGHEVTMYRYSLGGVYL